MATCPVAATPQQKHSCSPVFSSPSLGSLNLPTDMWTQPKVTTLVPYVNALHQLHTCLGLSNCTYNARLRRVEYSRQRSLLSLTILRCLQVFCGVLLSALVFCVLFRYLTLNADQSLGTAIETQETLLSFTLLTSSVLSVFLVTSSFLSFNSAIIPTVNELMDIFTTLERMTDSRIFFPSSFRVLLLAKLVICGFTILSVFLRGMQAVFTSRHSLCQYLETFIAETFLIHVLSQLVLICFYMKMSSFLATASGRRSPREFSKCARAMLKLSFRIHRLKVKLNGFFSRLFLSAYLRLFKDICLLYEVLKIVVYAKSSSSFSSKAAEVLNKTDWNFPSILSTCLDIYLLGRLSDMLIESERIFGDLILLAACRGDIEHRNGLADREVDTSIFLHNVFDLSTSTCQMVRFDQPFAFEFATNIVFIYGIFCLQFYAGEVVYSRHHGRRGNVL